MPTSDFTTAGPAKQQTRLDNLAAVQQSSILWSRKNKNLHFDWGETAGRLAPTLHLLREHDALGPDATFIGFDLPDSQHILDECEDQYGTHDAKWVAQDLMTALRTHNPFPNMGVLVWDSCDAARGQTVQRHLDTLIPFAQRQESRLGSFLLVINVSLFRVHKGADQYVRGIRRHLPTFDPDTAFHRYCSEGRQHDMLLTRLRFGF